MSYWPPDVKDKAREQVHKAIREGVIVRPKECQSCGVECKPDGHHYNYDKPLVVVWVCRLCHKRIHIRLEKDRKLESNRIYRESVNSSKKLLDNTKHKCYTVCRIRNYPEKVKHLE